MKLINVYDNEGFRTFTRRQELDKALHTLEGILQGINIDGVINKKELDELLNWCSLYQRFSNRHPFNELIPIVENALSDSILSEDEYQDVLWLCNNFKSDNLYYDMTTSDMQRLQGILHGILADNDITEEELYGLQAWIDENEHLSGIYPYDEIHSVITTVLEDRKVDETEKLLLKAFFSDFFDLRESINVNQVEINDIKQTISIGGVICVCPKINIKDSMFCFTGASSKSTRTDIQTRVETLGGMFNNNVVNKTDYLVIGNNGNPAWAFSCYGRKVEKAVELRKAGHKILIIHEDDFWDAVEDIG